MILLLSSFTEEEVGVQRGRWGSPGQPAYNEPTWDLHTNNMAKVPAIILLNHIVPCGAVHNQTPAPRSPTSQSALVEWAVEMQPVCTGVGKGRRKPWTS